MNWFFELAPGERAAAVLGLSAAAVLLVVARLSAAGTAVAALLAPALAAAAALWHSSGGTPAGAFPVLLVLAATLVCGLLVRADELADARHRAECVVLQLLGAAGACVLVDAADCLRLLLGFESMSLAVAVLAGIGRGPRALEVAFRFFVLSAASAATLIYGIGLHAYATGSFALDAAPLAGDGMAVMADAAGVLMGLGIAFELALVPAHFGVLGIGLAAPLSCTSFALTVSKVGAALALARLCAGSPMLQQVFAVLAVVTILWATFGGLAQRHLRGVIAYSAVGHGGFLALAAACGASAHDTLAFYALVYVASAALVLAAMSGSAPFADGREPTFAEFARSPLGGGRRFAAVFGLLSLAGVPPGPGLLAKIAILAVAWTAVGPALTVLAALGGVFSVLYYLRPVPELLAGWRAEAGERAASVGVRVAIVAGVLVCAVCAVAPHFAVRLAG